MATTPYAATPVFPTSVRIIPLNTIITIPEESWDSSDGNPRARLIFTFSRGRPVFTIWNPLDFFSQWGAMIRMPIAGDIPVASTAPKIPIPIGNINT